MAFQDIPDPQIIRILPHSQPIVRPEPTDLRQQRVDEFLSARSLAPKSKKAYQEDLARFMAWTEAAWSQVTPRQVAQFKNYLLRLHPETGRRILSDASVKRVLQTLKNFCNWMVLSGYLDRNPTHAVSLPKLPAPEANHLTEQQMQDIFQVASVTNLSERNLALLSVLRHGLRAQESSNLNVGDFDGQRVKIRQAKADSKGSVPLDLDAQMWVNQYLQWREAQGEILTEESPLFASHSNRNQGQRMGYHAIHKLMKAIAAEVGFDFHAHQFRHTFATNLVLKGMNPYHAMTLTRHKSPQTFRRYTMAADEMAAEQAFRALS
jgi:integrase/recombinase XerD